MKANQRFIPNYFIFMLLLAACSTDSPRTPEELKKARLDSIQTSIQTQEKMGKEALSREQQTALFKSYQEYYNASGKDTVGLNYLFEAANLAQGLGKYEKAIELFINFHDGFPASHRCDEAVYNIAYIYDARLKNPEKATTYYNKVIELYPNSLWANEAKGALHFVGLSDEEMIRKLDEINKQKP
jgi:tetratricopeptide (TPR) repeat protein